MRARPTSKSDRPVIRIESLTLQRGTKPLFENASAMVYAGEKAGLVGANGSGKSTLFAMLRGKLHADGGELDFPASWRVAHVAQETPAVDRTALDYALDGDTRLREIEARLAEAQAAHDGHAEAEAHIAYADADGYTAASRASTLLMGLGFSLAEISQPVASFSGGWRMRLNLAQALMCPSDLLLLDEPTNHLDAESVAWLERFLQEYPGTVVAVTHDRYFLDNVAGWILELDRGHGIPWQGNYSSWLEQKEKRLEIEEKQETAHIKAMKAELEWVRTNPKGRQAKSKARIAKFEELSSQEFQKRNETQELYIPPGPRLGELVVEAKGLKKSFGDRLLFDGLDFNLPQGGIVGIIGANGAGKTTLFRMITGGEKPDAGEMRIGPSVKIAYVDQSRDSLRDDKTVWEEISDGQDLITVGTWTTPSRAYVGRFNFRGTDQQKQVGTLSGGERNRVHLAKLLKSGGNVLLLDEPTNDLDVETLRALEEAVLAFPGCAVIISHDRWFLDRVATHILAFEGDSKVVWFEGNYADYEADRKRRLGADADQPHRIKYRRLKD